MLSNHLKSLLTLLNFTPILFILGVVDLSRKLLANVDRGRSCKLSFHDFFWLVVFAVCVAICWLLLKLAIKHLPIYTIQIKSIKSSDLNFTPMLLSYFLPVAKLQFKTWNDNIFLVVTLLLFFLLARIAQSTYHFNPILRLIFGYKYYEVQTKKEVTFLMLSKETLVNPDHIHSYIVLTDSVVLNLKGTHENSK